jgi:hypothetical protein
MTDDRPTDTRAMGGTADDPLPITKADVIAEIDALPEGTGCGSYATESPKGGERSDWPRDYSCD